MHDPHRRLLLELYRALLPAAPPQRPTTAHACAAAWELPLQLMVAAAAAPAARLAVRLVHQLEMGTAPLCAHLGPLAAEGDEEPALCAALAGAPLIAGRDGRALLAIALDVPAGAEPQGALVDAETCARIALAGGELESGQARALELLELAGDLVPAVPTAPGAVAAGTVLLAALRLEPAQALRCLRRQPATTMRDKQL
ncbi:MAG: hypothetical protein IT480_09230 [Gammaproteobacteria bacterium]|nr:hypothetical protein [Gammaproteobacteria bacterium]